MFQIYWMELKLQKSTRMDVLNIRCYVGILVLMQPYNRKSFWGEISKGSVIYISWYIAEYW